MPERVSYMDDSTTLKYIRAVLAVADRKIKENKDNGYIKTAIKTAAYDSINDIVKGEKENDV